MDGQFVGIAVVALAAMVFVNNGEVDPTKHEYTMFNKSNRYCGRKKALASRVLWEGPLRTPTNTFIHLRQVTR